MNPSRRSFFGFLAAAPVAVPIVAAEMASGAEFTPAAVALMSHDPSLGLIDAQALINERRSRALFVSSTPRLFADGDLQFNGTIIRGDGYEPDYGEDAFEDAA